MSAEMYNVSLFKSSSNEKELLTKEEVRQYCKHYNQHSVELDQFLARFDFEKWVCLGVDIEAVYYKHTKEGQMDCSAAEFLGIMLTSLYDDKYETALKKYLGQRPVDGILRFDVSEKVYDKESDTLKVISRAKTFNQIENCPLWVVKVDDFSDYYLSGIVLIPMEFWNSDALMYESAGYPYTLNDRNWYSWDKAIAYRMNRVGGWSPNFLLAEKSTLDLPRQPYQYDAATNRLFKSPADYNPKELIEYYDLNDNEAFKEIEGFKPVGLNIKEEAYHVYTKKGLVKINKDFEKLALLTNKTGLMSNTVLREYEGKGWSIILTSKGIDITSPKTQQQTKLSAFKIKAGDAGPRRLLIHAVDEDHLVLLTDKLIVVNADLKMVVHSIKRNFKKALGPWLGKDPIGVAYTNTAIDIEGQQPLFFLNNLAISLNDKYEPVLMNFALHKITGEFNFYSAVVDPKRKGFWLLAGLDRLVFVKNDLKEAIVFNTEAEGSIGPAAVLKPWIHLDKDGNLRYSLNYNGAVREVKHKELAEQLKTAIPYQQ